MPNLDLRLDCSHGRARVSVELGIQASRPLGMETGRYAQKVSPPCCTILRMHHTDMSASSFKNVIVRIPHHFTDSSSTWKMSDNSMNL
nr:hypothetical protein CFP56_78597 [Quercus suber]